MNSKAALGFTYVVEVVSPDGTVSQRETVHNLIPVEGLNHMMAVTFKRSTPVDTWYIALYEGNYTPVPLLTAATFPAAATESIAYTPTPTESNPNPPDARVAFVPGEIANGAVDNSAARAEFTFIAAKTIYGGAILSASPKGATTGIIISAVRFASPKVLEVGSTLRVLAGNSLVSA